ncbi:MAG TPA: MFS transporter [Terracidiphilus sp.]|jgi:MFS transporter, SHS family, lactate transporter|nr:MFS transporter [Terracidiphilus sp.]
MDKSQRRAQESGAVSQVQPAGAVAQAPLPARWGFAVSSGILGWILDAFTFFILIFVVDALAANFHVTKAAIVWSITITLATRPIGALVLGSVADKFGRRRPLIACVLLFSIFTALTPFAPNYTVFILYRALYGIGMGGYWGIGASLVMESSPSRWRGLFSGILQAGYSLGYLLAAVAVRTIEPRFGWRWMFLSGLFIAALVAVLTVLSPEPAAWKKNRSTSFGTILRTPLNYKRDFAYLVLLMTVITCLSHGTQDLYPDFLKSVHNLSNVVISNLTVFYNVGAILGCLLIGHLSERFGRRNSIMLALCICVISIPAWAFGTSLAVLALGSFMMQFGVQGVFGVIPAHLNELSPASVRSLFPGVVYQLGMLFGAPSVGIEFALRNSLGYSWALTSFELCTIAALFLICAFGPERRGHDLAS